jgi:hypothetical protein
VIILDFYYIEFWVYMELGSLKGVFPFLLLDFFEGGYVSTLYFRRYNIENNVGLSLLLRILVIISSSCLECQTEKPASVNNTYRLGSSLFLPK